MSVGVRNQLRFFCCYRICGLLLVLLLPTFYSESSRDAVSSGVLKGMPKAKSSSENDVSISFTSFSVSLGSPFSLVAFSMICLTCSRYSSINAFSSMLKNKSVSFSFYFRQSYRNILYGRHFQPSFYAEEWKTCAY